ncbi:unnamed protein product, partial [Owenia fusiformis]
MTNTRWRKESSDKYSKESEDSLTSRSSSRSSSAESSSEISATSDEELDNAIDVVVDDIDELEFSEDELTMDDLKEAEYDTVDELNESVGATDGMRRKHNHHPRQRGRGM